MEDHRDSTPSTAVTDSLDEHIRRAIAGDVEFQRRIAEVYTMEPEMRNAIIARVAQLESGARLRADYDAYWANDRG